MEHSKFESIQKLFNGGLLSEQQGRELLQERYGMSIRWDENKGMVEENTWKSAIEVKVEKLMKFVNEQSGQIRRLEEAYTGVHERMTDLENWHSTLAQQVQKSDMQEQVEKFSLLDSL